MTVKRIQNNCDKFALVCLTDSYRDTEIEYRDTVIYVDIPVEVKLPPDTAEIEVTIPCPEFINISPVTVEKGLVGATARVIDNRLIVRAYLTDSLYVTRLQDSIRILNAVKQTVVTETNTITVKEDTMFGKFTKRWFWGSVLIIIGGIAFLVLKTYFKKLT